MLETKSLILNNLVERYSHWWNKVRSGANTRHGVPEDVGTEEHIYRDDRTYHVVLSTFISLSYGPLLKLISILA